MSKEQLNVCFYMPKSKNEGTYYKVHRQGALEPHWSFLRKWFEPRSNTPWLKTIIWVIGVPRRTVVCDWRFYHLCGNHLQSGLLRSPPNNKPFPISIIRGWEFNKTARTLAFLGYEIGTFWLFTISYPTRAHGIIDYALLLLRMRNQLTCKD